MADWEFLIQRENDRGWRPIKTGNLQLIEGKYRIAANSNLINTQIQTRVTHQTLGAGSPQRRSQSRIQTTNSSGLLVFTPFTHLHSGIWQFVCSGTTATETGWHRILKLRVLPSTQSPDPITAVNPLQVVGAVSSPELLPRESLTAATPAQTAKISPEQLGEIDESSDCGVPTAPIVSISMLGEQENWADGLDRLLAQLERDSLATPPQQSAIGETEPSKIRLRAIVDPPLQMISLDRSTFAGMIPGNRFMISGACNLQLLNANLVQTVKIEKLSICLRHPQTSAIISSIEQSLPPNLDTFTFRGQLELPIDLNISLLIGEVNLYDRHHIQIGSSGFTVTLSLNPLNESELSLLQLFDLHQNSSAPTLDASAERFHQRLTQELQLEAATISPRDLSIPPSSPPTHPSTIKPLNSAQYTHVPLAYQRESPFTHPDLIPVEPSAASHLPRPAAKSVQSSNSTIAVDVDVVAIPDLTTKTQLQTQHPKSSQSFSSDITGDLEIDFGDPSFTPGASLQARYHNANRSYENLEIVIDD